MAPSLREVPRALGPALAALNLACPIEAGFTFVFDRAPDFFAWPDAAFDRYRYLGAFHGERLVGYALCGVTRGFTGAAATPYFYAGDLRVHPAARGAGLAMQLTLAHLDVLPEDCPAGFFLVKEGNRPAEEMVKPSRRVPRVVHRPLCRLEAQNALLLRLPAPPGRARVRPAAAADLEPIAALVRRALGARLFGPAPDAAALAAAAERGRGPVRTYVAERGGRLVGTVTAWDQDDLRRTRVLRYPLGAHLLRGAYALGRRVFPGAPALPPAGGALRAVTLTRLAVADRDPAVLADLLGAVARDHRARGYHLIHLGFAHGDPLAAATRGYLTQRFCSRVWVALPRGGGDPPLPAGARDPYLDLAII
ncbi:MAG TPA: GNAT family N-acetyltransferase [Polyangia bacterium]